MVSFTDFLPDLVGAGANWLAGRDASKSQTDANQATIAGQAANQEKSLQAFTGSTPFSKTERTPEGGFNVSFGPAGEAAAEARRKRAVGDIARADIFNRTATAAPTFGSIGAAKDYLSRDTNRARANFMDQINRVTQRDKQMSQGVPSTNDLGRLAGKLAPAFRQFETADIDALDVFNRQETTDRAKAADIQNLNRPQAPAPGFTDKTPGNIASQAIYSTPPPATIPDMSGAVGYKAVGNYLTDLRNQDRATAANKAYYDQQNKLMNAIYANRQLPNEGPS
jgi:hypothetical protein